jgi:hypothetical protein
MRKIGKCLILAAAVGLTACVSQQQQLDSRQDEAINMAVNRAKFELNCPAATGEVLSREVVQPALNGPMMMGVERVEYTIGVAGCNQRNTYVVLCPLDGQGCFAGDGRR